MTFRSMREIVADDKHCLSTSMLHIKNSVHCKWIGKFRTHREYLLHKEVIKIQLTLDLKFFPLHCGRKFVRDKCQLLMKYIHFVWGIIFCTERVKKIVSIFQFRANSFIKYHMVPTLNNHFFFFSTMRVLKLYCMVSYKNTNDLKAVEKKGLEKKRFHFLSCKGIKRIIEKKVDIVFFPLRLNR